MVPEKICDASASAGTWVLLACGNILVDARLDRVTAMSSSELRALAAALPRAGGAASEPPRTPLYLERDERDLGRFSVHAAAYARSQPDLPAELIDFNRSPEVVVSRFASGDGAAVITLAKYPTPAIARQQFEKWEQWSKSRPSAAGAFQMRRSGPIVAAVSGQIAEPAARKMLEAINYEADVTWNEPTFLGKKDNIGNLVYAAMMLSILIIAVTFVFGLIFGFFRVAMRRLFPGRFIDRPEDVEFIQLRLDKR